MAAFVTAALAFLGLAQRMPPAGAEHVYGRAGVVARREIIVVGLHVAPYAFTSLNVSAGLRSSVRVVPTS